MIIEKDKVVSFHFKVIEYGELLESSGSATPGWFSVVVGILFLVFLQTGALTLMTLMLTGIVKSGAPPPVPASYKEFVDRIFYADCNAKN